LEKPRNENGILVVEKRPKKDPFGLAPRGLGFGRPPPPSESLISPRSLSPLKLPPFCPTKSPAELKRNGACPRPLNLHIKPRLVFAPYRKLEVFFFFFFFLGFKTKLEGD